MTRITDSELTEWSLQLNTLTPSGRLPRRGSPRAAMADFIAGQLKDRVKIRPTIYPEFSLFSEQQVNELLRIARDFRGESRDYMGRHVLAAPGAVKSIVTDSGVVDRLAAEHALTFRPDNEALLLYYRKSNWVPMHLDDQLEYEFNLLTMLRRVKSSDASRTATYFWGAGGDFMATDLRVGESVFFHASYTPHGRPPLPEGEEVVLLAVGMGRPREQ
ncbi:hypothetical protein [Streptomyces sp. UNOC14_S4]|uniref:hypothetical protein n=1 Tax=Streptomyces sp. UNOC14_S4 TaxID=2872340 RepID=UPI001E3D42FF|nr:hypothetical protein [Streptomyces sp. UNOC14_S4]MCC3766712.1 hypothetical protein [Streptomyces sp. UNOC14_S4]